MIEDTRVVLYRKGRPGDFRAWIADSLRVLSGRFQLTHGHVIIAGPNSHEPALSAWDQLGGRVFSLERVAAEDMASIVISSPEDVEYVDLGATAKAHARTKQCQWMLEADAPPYRYIECADAIAQADALQRRRDDAVLVVSLGSSLVLADSKAAIDIICSLSDPTSSNDGCYYGFVAIVDGDSDSMGMLYGRNTLEPYAPTLETEERSWWAAGDQRRQLLRGVYWGNLLGAEVVRRIEQSAAARKAIEERDDQDASLGRIIRKRYANGSELILLSSSPTHASQGSRAHQQYCARRGRVAASWRSAGIIVEQLPLRASRMAGGVAGRFGLPRGGVELPVHFIQRRKRRRGAGGRTGSGARTIERCSVAGRSVLPRHPPKIEH